jgi:hypothetical protein
MALSSFLFLKEQIKDLIINILVELVVDQIEFRVLVCRLAMIVWRIFCVESSCVCKYHTYTAHIPPFAYTPLPLFAAVALHAPRKERIPYAGMNT